MIAVNETRFDEYRTDKPRVRVTIVRNSNRLPSVFSALADTTWRLTDRFASLTRVGPSSLRRIPAGNVTRAIIHFVRYVHENKSGTEKVVRRFKYNIIVRIR